MKRICSLLVAGALVFPLVIPSAGAAEAAPALKAYGDLRDFYGCQATLYGTTTMLGAMLTEKWETFPLSPLPCPGRTGSM